MLEQKAEIERLGDAADEPNLRDVYPTTPAAMTQDRPDPGRGEAIPNAGVHHVAGPAHDPMG